MQIRIGVLLFGFVLLMGCPNDADGEPEVEDGGDREPDVADGGDGEPQEPGEPTPGVVPRELVGSWVAGGRGTTQPYDPDTGQWGAADGDMLMYSFHADGSFEKSFLSQLTTGGCTSRVMAYETGRYTSGSELVLQLQEGVQRVRFSCTPSLDSDEALAPDVERFTWQRQGEGLLLIAPNGARQLFRTLE